MSGDLAKWQFAPTAVPDKAFRLVGSRLRLTLLSATPTRVASSGSCSIIRKEGIEGSAEAIRSSLAPAAVKRCESRLWQRSTGDYYIACRERDQRVKCSPLAGDVDVKDPRSLDGGAEKRPIFA